MKMGFCWDVHWCWGWWRMCWWRLVCMVQNDQKKDEIFCFYFPFVSSSFHLLLISKVLYLLYLKLGEGNDWSEKEISRNMCVYIFTVMECLVKIDFWRHLVGIGPLIYILYDLILLVFLSYVFFVSSKLYQFRKWREEQNSKILYTKKKKSEINPKWISC